MLLFATLGGIAIVNATPYIPGLNGLLGLKALNPWFYLLLASLVIIYISLVMIVRLIYKKKYKEIL